MPRWVRRLFIDMLPSLLFMRRPTHRKDDQPLGQRRFDYHQRQTLDYAASLAEQELLASPDIDHMHLRRRPYSSDVQKAIDGIRFIADHIRETDAFGNVIKNFLPNKIKI